MWSRTPSVPNDDNHNNISIINRFFDFINNTRRINNRIIDQNDNLAEMGYEMILAYLYSNRNSNTNINRNNTIRVNTNTNTNNTNTNTNNNI